jgi:hypothetical protein
MSNITVNDLLSRIDTSTLYPLFVAKIRLVLQDCINQGYYYYVTSGERTWDEQQKLYDKGRVPVNTGHHVTNAKPGFSGHNFAIAVDACHDADSNKVGLQPDYTDSHYKVLADAGVKYGLTAGYYWTKEKEGIHDPPHLQLNVKSKHITWAKLREEYHKGGNAAVFKYLDQFNWE